jgi:small subunit ribosomal protein S14
MRKRLIYKNQYTRINFFKIELYIKILKIILLDKKLDNNIRIIITNLLFKLCNKKRNCTMLQSICTLTGNPRSCFSKFKLNRIKFKQLGEDGFIIGLGKRTW